MAENETECKARGGCLDTLVQIVSFGQLGIEAVIIQSKLRPTDFNDLSNIKDTPIELAFKTRQTVIVQNFKPRIERRIVRNKV